MGVMKIQKPEEEWKKNLTPKQYKILREKGTEAPFTGEFLNTTDNGMYHCAACGNPLFDSSTKFKSGTGWPSFYDVVSRGNIQLEEDNSFGMKRTEVKCSNCGSHLGHVFPDGSSKETGVEYCINSSALNFKKR